ncbi:MAG: hypothetical protein WBE20_00565 [Candidatus Acidiferrales bacterium]
MSTVTHDQVNLMLQLYEMRREPRLRQARAWFVSNFHPAGPEDVTKIAPPGSEANASMRMVTSYWEMVANIVSRGLIDEEFFFETSGEQWIVWDRLKPIVGPMRAMMKNPHAWEKLEQHVARFEAWRERRAPGHNEVIRQMMKQMTAQALPSKSAAAGGKRAKKRRR